MKADIQSVSKSRSVLDVTASPEEVAKVRADVTKSFAAQASLPGFRKGHAPAAMVAKAYGDRIAHEAEDRAVREAYEKAVEENGLKVFEIVSIEDRRANEDGSLSFKATVDLVPTFDLPDLDGIPVDATDTAVTDEQVQAQIDGARRSLAKFEDLAAGDEVKAEDMVQLDYSAKAEDGRPLAEAHPDAAAFAEKKGAWCTVDSEYFLVPGLPKDLVGRKVGLGKRTHREHLARTGKRLGQDRLRHGRRERIVHRAGRERDRGSEYGQFSFHDGRSIPKIPMRNARPRASGKRQQADDAT